MSEEKRIEEMAKCCTYYHNGECCADATKICDCDLMCEMFGVFANLDNADYRKQNEGEWEYDEDCECFACSVCGYSALNNYRMLSTPSNYCPHCGAKMKGGAE